MRIGILSDVHGNRNALDASLSTLRDRGTDRIICLGDLVGYGPDPGECIEIIRDISDITIAGNHDLGMAGKLNMDRFSPVAVETIAWTRQVLDDDSKDYLGNLPMTAGMESLLFVHSSPDHPERWNYLLDPDRAQAGFEAMSTPAAFVGHSHIPGVFIRDEKGSITQSKPDDLILRPGHDYLINVGSVGQPRDRDPRACCGVLDTETRHFQWLRCEYDIRAVQERMADAGLPSFLISRLEYGR